MLKKIKTLIPVLTIFLMLGCKDNKAENTLEIETQTESSEKKNITEPTKTNKVESENFGGIWVNKKYADKLLATKSPKKSQDIAPITMMELPTDINKEGKVIWGFHEGVNAKIVRKNNGYEIQFKEGDEPAQGLELKDGMLKTKKDEFIKLNSAANKNDYHVVEELLFAGKYDLDGKQVEFTPTGKIIGWDNFTYYSVLIDYYDAGMQVDQIRLGKNFENSKLYGFDFKKDKLNIYELKCVEPEGKYCNVVKNGKRLYKLTKQ